MKKLPAVALSLTLLASIVPQAMAQDQANASSDSMGTSYIQTTFAAPEITDQAVLLDRAEKGIKDGTDKFNPHLDVIDEATGKKLVTDKVKTIYTVQKLKERVNVLTGDKIESFKAVSFTLPKDKKPLKDNVISPSLSDTAQGYDSTISVKATNIIYYDKASYGSFGHSSYKFTEIDGIWDRLDSTCNWSASELGYYQQGNGWDSNGNSHGGVVYDKMATVAGGYPTSGATYRYYPSSSNYYIESGGSISAEAGRMFINLAHGSSTWEFQFSNGIG